MYDFRLGIAFPIRFFWGANAGATWHRSAMRRPRGR